MVIGAGFASVPLSTVTVDGMSVTGLSPISAALIFVGIVILAFGLTVYFKGK
jgi:hypothetical protein